MPKSNELSIFERDEIVGLHKGQCNPTDISRILNILRTTVTDVISKWKKDGLVSPAPQSRRPPIFNDRDKRHLVQLLKNDRQQSVDEITEKFNELELKTSSSITIRCNLYELGYHGHAGIRKPLVSKSNRLKRLNWY